MVGRRSISDPTGSLPMKLARPVANAILASGSSFRSAIAADAS